MKFEEVAKAVGCPYSPDTTHMHGGSEWESAWDGKIMHGIYCKRPHDAQQLWHELAHWLCVETKLRHFVGFGGGESFDSAGTWQKYENNYSASDVNEETASALGIWLHWCDDPIEAFSHAKDHSWGTYPADGTVKSELYAQRNTGGWKRAVKRLKTAGITLLQPDWSVNHGIE